METISVTWERDARYRVAMGRHTLILDQPEADGGSDTGPSPAELLPAAMAGCVAYYVGIFLQSRDLPTAGLEVEIDTHSAENPYRLGRFDLRVKLPSGVPAKYRPALERAAGACTIQHTLMHTPEINLDFA